MQKEYNNPGYNFSSFQKKFISSTESSNTFKQWVHATLGTQIRERQWLCLLWYTVDGTLHWRRVGVKRLLGEECIA